MNFFRLFDDDGTTAFIQTTANSYVLSSEIHNYKKLNDNTEEINDDYYNVDKLIEYLNDKGYNTELIIIDNMYF